MVIRLPGPLAGELNDVAARGLRAIGQRLTANRRAVLAILADSDRPLTIHDILAIRPDLAQSSVYRTLVVLEQADVVHRVVTGGEFTRYELTEDLTQHHHHLVCVACGSVQDISAPPQLEQSVRRVITQLAEQEGFSASTHRLDLIGLCRRCA